jgi:hypothetical protein
LRQAGGRIVRLDAEMTLHDAQMTEFHQWWKRALRAGHAYAEGAALHGRPPECHWVKESRSIWFWGLGLPSLAIATAWFTEGASLLVLLLAYILLGYRVYKSLQWRNLPFEDALLYALFCTIGKFPNLQGQIQFYLSVIFNQQRTLVEYKRVTPLP